MAQYRIVLPLEVWDEFTDDENPESIKETLGEKLDALLESTDFLWDYFKKATVQRIAEDCRTDDCGGVGDSYDGYCPACADLIYKEEN